MTLSEARSRIAQSAVAVELETTFPAEVIAAQAALESGWLQRAPGNNPFGWKARDGEDRQLLETPEWLLADDAAKFGKADGRRILRATGKKIGMRSEYRVMDWFAKFPNLTAAFKIHATRLMTMPRYKPVWEEYRKLQFATRESGCHFIFRGIAKAGYATAPDYADRLMEIAQGSQLQMALDLARLQNTKET